MVLNPIKFSIGRHVLALWDNFVFFSGILNLLLAVEIGEKVSPSFEKYILADFAAFPIQDFILITGIHRSATGWFLHLADSPGFLSWLDYVSKVANFTRLKLIFMESLSSVIVTWQADEWLFSPLEILYDY